MSWAEVFKINKNMKKALNEQLRDLKFQPIRIITSSITYTPEKTGIYKIICVGKGGDGSAASASNIYGGASGGGGGVAIKTMRLSSSSSYSVTVGTSASFAYTGGAITATAGGGASSWIDSAASGGTASGGDYNFTGTSGSYTRTNFTAPTPGSVGVAITDLIRTPPSEIITQYQRTVILRYGDCLLNYGGAGTGAGYYASSSASGEDYRSGMPAAVLIIPLELEE